MEEQICILDTGLAPQREGDSQRAVGLAECDSGVGPVGENNEGDTGEIGAVDGEATYFVDTTPVLVDSTSRPEWEYWQGGPAYHRDILGVLGHEELDIYDESLDTSLRRCFNCGAVDHTVSDCPSPRNHALISLSRQLFTFHQPTHRQGLGNSERIHTVEAWKQQRLDWLDYFEPGQIKGELLREALWSRDDENDEEGDQEWLKNMTIWGYPKGWVGQRDPRYEVTKRIEGDGESYDGGVFMIFGDVGEEEISLASNPQENLDSPDSSGSGLVCTSIADPSTEYPICKSPSPDPPLTLHRWASYPLTYFSSALLPIYTGHALPPLVPASEPFTNDKHVLWQNITSGSTQSLPPPPPPISPPPLPPSPPAHFPATMIIPPEESDGEAEMDLSDSD